MADEQKFADEMLTDDELDQVAGGTWEETANDSSWLKVLGLLKESRTASDIAWTSDTILEDQVRAAYAKLGIGLNYHGGAVIKNGYYFGQQSLTQEEAHKLAKEQAQKLKLGVYSY